MKASVEVITTEKWNELQKERVRHSPQITSTSMQGVAPTAIACSAWIDALAIDMERRIQWLARHRYGSNVELRDEVEFWLKKLRAGAEGASIAAICREGGQTNEK